MSKKDELTEEVNSILNILMTAQESFNVLKRLVKEPKNRSEANIKLLSQFFDYSRYVYWRITVIELAKLYTDSDFQKFNLIKFINKLKKGGYFQFAKIREDLIIHWHQRIVEQELTIKHLVHQRDKGYAHSDRGFNLSDNPLSIGETEELLKLAREIIRAIYLGVFNSDYLFELYDSPADNLDEILKILSDVREVELKQIDELEREAGL